MLQRRHALTVTMGVLVFATLSALGLARDPQDTQLVRMRAQAFRAAEQLDVRPGTVLDYGPFVWLELGSEDVSILRESGLAFQERPDAHTLHLGEQSEGVVTLRADDDVIVYDDTQALGRFHNLLCHFDIGPRRRGISGRVVVHEYECGRR